MAIPVRVLVVDDSTFVRRAVRRMLSTHETIELVGTAADGVAAVRMAKALRPDVVLMDVHMPRMGGMEALERIRAEVPDTAVLLMSTATGDGAETTLRGLELGAVDFIDKGSVGAIINLHDLAPTLVEKILTASKAASPDLGHHASTMRTASPLARRPSQSYSIIAIGASTGGPRALAMLMEALPAGLNAALLVAQHMPAGFTRTLADRLDRRSPLSVSEAVDGDNLRAGHVLLAPGRCDMTVKREANGALVARVSHPHPKGSHHPSVDALFRSLARVAAPRTVGVVLTGMGEDGAQGLRELLSAGAHTIVEHADTAVIYGMPKAARAAAKQAISLHAMAAELARLCAPPSEVREGGG